ncbi:hypothetical protein ZHAS_00004000 [Anopheles sinensis]|uniref:Uncharacterized protein n=1 Tax=Anopheles sinensis TaxID=74873 RepID=A0A084VFU1_ANOSI|nr:hypothetical protein ZHAS_00004000 [Anopheles sinensis]
MVVSRKRLINYFEHLSTKEKLNAFRKIHPTAAPTFTTNPVSAGGATKRGRKFVLACIGNCRNESCYDVCCGPAVCVSPHTLVRQVQLRCFII